MNDQNGNKEKKGGALPWLSNIFRGGSSSVGGASSGFGGSSGGLAGLFATKAGIVGMVLGGATIAAGVGVIYNFVGPSSKGVYSPELFQNSYYEEESSKAGLERSKSHDASAAASSTLDMFKEQAKKDGLGLASEAGDADKANASAENPSAANGAAASADAPAAAGAPGAGGAGIPKMQAGAGFGGKGGGGSGSGSSIPRMQGGGGLSGGIGAQFGSVYRPPAQANAGKTSGMSANAARVTNSPKYSVPNFNKKGAYGQAKYAGNMGAKAAYSADGSGARTSATNAFSGETTGGGDVATPLNGIGLGGAGVSGGQALKASDPSLNSNDSTPPAVPDPTKTDPWQKYEDDAMKSMMWALGLIIVTKILSNIAKKLPGPWALGFYIAAMAAAAVAIYFAVKVIMDGYAMYSQFGQKMMGGIYMLTGVMLALKALQALMDAAGGAGNAGSAAATPETTTTAANGTTTITAAKPAVDPILGQGNFLQGMNGDMFDVGKLL